MSDLEQQHGGGRPAADRRLVLVIGPGRSGTSTIAGALALSGVEVAGEALTGNTSNPSGFYEPRWVVDFHKELLAKAAVRTLDTDPEAPARVEGVLRAPARRRLAGWLEERAAQQPQMVVKDPRIVWFRELWLSAAEEVGLEPRFVTMLRHPAEVSASRRTYYARNLSAEEDPNDVTRIGGWVNVALAAELASRSLPRAFVLYPELVADWRSTLTRVGERLDLRFDPGPEVSPHPVDDFIDPTLHRVRVAWDDVHVPGPLQELAERTWTALTALTSLPGAAEEPPAVLDELDTLREDYARMTRDALALTRHAVQRIAVDARRKGRRAGREDARSERPPPPVSPDPEPARGSLLGRLARGVQRR